MWLPVATVFLIVAAESMLLRTAQLFSWLIQAQPTTRYAADATTALSLPLVKFNLLSPNKRRICHKGTFRDNYFSFKY
jgi:hypothetical protein